MFGSHLPAGLPGTLAWKADQLGIPAYNLALTAAGGHDRTGNQARFYLAMMRHRQLRHAALAAAAAQQTA